MLALLFLVVTSLAGFAVATRAVPTAPTIVRLPAGFLLAIVFTSWTTYLVANGLAGTTDASLRIGLIASTVLGAVVLLAFGRSLRPRDLRLTAVDVGLTAVALLLSWWMIKSHLRVENDELLVSANTWGDMGLHVALSRSFSVAANYPTEYPFFAGEPIRYHFGFDFFAGVLQEGGFSVLHSFNVPGIIGFTAMMLVTFATARLLFGPAEPQRWWRDRGVWAGFVAVALLMTNQSLGWLRFITEAGKGSVATALRPSVWWEHEGYLTGGPYTDERIVMFNTPNVYLTQMHLIIAMALVLTLTYVVLWQLRDGDGLSKRLLVGVGVAFGAGFWLNGVVWLAAAVFLGLLLALWGLAAGWTGLRAADRGARWTALRGRARTWLTILACFVVPALALGVPQALMLNGGSTSGGLGIHLGYLVCSSTTASCHEAGQMDLLSLRHWGDFVEYWWLNAGLFIPLLVLAFVIGSARDRKIIGAITGIFIWGSVFYVGQDVGGQNHKVFNLWENLSGLFVAFAVVSLWIAAGRLLRRGRGLRVAGVAARLATGAMVVLLTISGFIDFMTIKNDFVVSIFGDVPQQQATNWIIEETAPRATFLTDYDQLYTAPTMAGRGIALGYSSWASSAGYEIEPRQRAIVATYAAPDRTAACASLASVEMDYVLVGPQERTSPRFKVNEAVFAEMTPAATFGEGDQQYRIYRVADNCSPAALRAAQAYGPPSAVQ